MTANTGRIDIQGQFGIFNSQPISVARAMPAVLSGHMSDYEWNQFCDKLDETLAPLSRVKKLQRALMVASLLAFVLFAVAGFVFVATADPGNSFQGFYILFVVAGLAMLGCIAVPMYMARKSEQVQRELSRVCDEESAKNSQISFHVRFESHLYTRNMSHMHHGNHHHRHGTTTISSYTTNYIEVQVSGDAHSPAVPTVWAEPETVVVKTAEERLEELERIKPHLSSEEYQRKRQEILAAV